MIIISRRAIRFFELFLGKGIGALAFYPFIFIDPKTKITKELINHEKIHLRQQIELLIIPFLNYFVIMNIKQKYLEQDS